MVPSHTPTTAAKQPDWSPDMFRWEPQPAAQKLVSTLIAEFAAKNAHAADLAQRMKDQTGTRFQDWIDYLQVPTSPGLRAKLLEVGFSHRPQPGAPEHFTHEGAIFPSIILSESPTRQCGIKVDHVADFLATWKLEHPIEGDPFSQFRRALAFHGTYADLYVVERHGYRGFSPVQNDHHKIIASLRHLERFRTRHRDFGVDDQADLRGFTHTEHLIDDAVRDLGRDWACDLFFQAERDYWQRRTRAGRVQKARQDALGLGWANHDHHTYRSSRHCYPALIRCLEKLGFRGRERFYAGHEAFWGAQVIEQTVAGITIFADVDMTPEELVGDFPHEGFKTTIAQGKLGTIGLWCELHGEAFLQAGMHHLECQFDWHALKAQLEKESIKMMDPFTTFPHLRQAFTEGERWPVDARRTDMLVSKGLITAAQGETFRKDGALGSHLENLERNDGFKGFNQQGVSDIISRTDARKQTAGAGA
ncbi:MAG: hypothetical protein HEQ23_05965 [Tepidisphaera sp.]